MLLFQQKLNPKLLVITAKEANPYSIRVETAHFLGSFMIYHPAVRKSQK